MAQVTTMHHHHHLSSMRSSSDAERERERLVTLAVAMVENAAQQGTRVSVRTAAKRVGLPKSTVHRYIRARLGVESPRRRSSSGKNGSRSRVSPPKKCGISFILDDPSPVEKFKKLSLSDSPVLQSDSRGPSRPSSGRGNSPFHSHSHGHSSRSPAAHHGYPTLSHHHIQQHQYGVQSNHQVQMPPYRMAHAHYGLE